MKRKFLTRMGTLGVAIAIAGCLGLGGVASAASIHLTGPDSVNIIRSSGSFGNQGNISLTGPGSVNEIISGGKSHNKNNGNIRFISSNHHVCNVSSHQGNFFKPAVFVVSHEQHQAKSFESEHVNKQEDFPQVSFNRHESSRMNTTTVRNNNDINVSNQNHQVATTGSVNVSGNTVVEGNISSGSAQNWASNQADVNVSNNSANGNSSNWSGSDWSSRHESSRNSFSQTNNNNIDVSNSNNQTARTGNVTVSHNTLVEGDVSSGSARNSASNTANVMVSNN